MTCSPCSVRASERRAGAAERSEPRQRLFLGVVAVGFVILLWMRGLGRFLVPLLVIGGVVYAVHRFV